MLDGNFGVNIQNQQVTGPDFGTNSASSLGIPGTNDADDIRASGLPYFDNGYTIGTTPNWMPLFRTRAQLHVQHRADQGVSRKHDVRLGVDVVRHELNHVQAEFGDIGGVRGGFRFSGTITGVARLHAAAVEPVRHGSCSACRPT